MATLVDTNVLIDVAYRDPHWMQWSKMAMAQRVAEGLVINPVIFAEFSYHFDSADSAEAALDIDGLNREHLPWESAYLAGRAFRLYRRRGGARQGTLPDFFIGAHAAVRGYSVLTRDPFGFREYFPALSIVAPDTHP